MGLIDSRINLVQRSTFFRIELHFTIFPHAYRASLSFNVYHIHYVSLYSVLLSLFVFVHIFRSFFRGGKEIDFVIFGECFVYSVLCECYVVFTWILYCK